jgi:NADPH-dependent glutamate synthase beta subunit-like oxidoreductase
MNLEKKNIKIDIIDQDPHPYGLIRNGVAPDHQAMKKIQYDYDVVFKDKNCNFYGNIKVGQDVDILTLLKNYSGVILAYGASVEKDIGIEGENHLTSATDMINWYNGKLDYFHEFQNKTNFKFDELRDVSVIGNGNVATDLARIFLKTKQQLADSDMPESVMEVFKQNAINSVSLIARRGMYQSAFTTKEIREISRVEGVKMYMFKEEMEKSMNEGKSSICLDYYLLCI